MSGLRTSALIVAVSLALAAPAARAAAPGSPGGPGMPGTLRTARLPTGLTVVLAPDPEAAAVDVSVWYDAGLRAEPAAQRGIAHLFEHLMFDGSAHVARRGHQARVEAVGGSAGAITTADGIGFFETVPAAGLDTALVLEADRMTGLTLDAARLDDERAGVKVERMQPGLNSPLQVGQRLAAETAFGAHPYASPVMGSDSALARMTLKDAQAWYRARFGPRRAVLTIVGRFDADATLEQVKRLFGPLKGGESGSPSPKLAESRAERRRWAMTPLSFPLLVAAWDGPARDDPDRVPLMVLARLLAHGDASRLATRLIGDDRDCFFLEGDLDTRRDASLFTIVAGVQPGADTAAVERAIVGAVERVASEAPADDEIARARLQIENGMLFSWQGTRGRGQAIGSAVAMGGDAGDPVRDLDRVRACTGADVQRAAARWLTASRRAIVWLTPRPGDAGVAGGAR